MELLADRGREEHRQDRGADRRPDWRMMSIAVLIRAIAAGGTACKDAVIVRIIETPIPKLRRR